MRLITAQTAEMKHVACIALLVALVLSSGCIEEGNGPGETPTRQSRIPANATKMTPGMDNHPAELHSDEWEEPVPMPGPVNTAGAEDSPFITPDGQDFYFVFVPDVSVPPEGQILDGVTGIYHCHRNGTGWTEPERVVLCDDLSLDGCHFVQGNEMWFCSVRKGNMREIDIYTAEFKSGRWTSVKSAGKKLNIDYMVGELHITCDGEELYYHSERPGGRGGTDIWVTRKVDGEWQEPENVEAVNTEVWEGMPFVSCDGEELWFNRWYQGTPGIFRCSREGDGWGEPELILSTFAGEPTLDDEGNLYFVHHYYEDGVMIEADIYVCYRK